MLFDERANSEPYPGHERMIVQACINGARDVDFHPALPLTVEAMARDGASCVAAGAAELHLHPRGPDRRESLGPTAMNASVLALRRACPGTRIGCLPPSGSNAMNFGR